MSQVPVQLLRRCPDGSLHLEEDLLREIVGRGDVGGRRVAVVAVVGAFRRGKSFLLNFMLRFLRAKGRPGWLGGTDEELSGFSWRGGSKRDTTGILVWPELFPVGDDLCVLLMDTQGTFDHVTSMRENTTIFAVSTLASSVQVYNLHERVQMDDLSNLQYFVEYGRLMQKESDFKAFQKLIFLVRDWKFPRENSFGFGGGHDLLQEWTKTGSDNPDQKMAAEMISECFSDTSCFLMPRPGDKVSFDEDFKGKLSDIHPEFLTHLRSFVEATLSEGGLAAKRVAGREVRASELPDLMRMYCDVTQGGATQPTTLVQSTAELHLRALHRDLLAGYVCNMTSLCSGVRPQPRLRHVHEGARGEALTAFESSRKFGGPALAQRVREELIKDIGAQFSRFEAEDQAKVGRERAEAARKELLAAREGGARRYRALMDAPCGGAKSVPDLAGLHQRSREVVLKEFRQVANKHGDQAKSHLKSLTKDMEDLFSSYRQGNDSKVKLEREVAMKETLRLAVETSCKKYQALMDARCGLKSVPNLPEIHEEALKSVTKEFNDLASKYDKKHVTSYRDKMNKNLKESLQKYEAANSKKQAEEKEAEELKKRLAAAAAATQQLQQTADELDVDPLEKLVQNVCHVVDESPVGRAVDEATRAIHSVFKSLF